MIAIPWYFAKNEDMTRFGLIYLLINILMLFWAPYSGILVDKYNRKHLFLWLTIICGTLIGAIAYYGFLFDGLSWFWVAIVFLITFLNYNVHYPNLYAFVQEISEPRYYGKITSYIEVQGQLSSMMAGGGAALLLEGLEEKHILGYTVNIEAWQIHEIFAMDAFTYLIALGIISLIVYQPLVRRETEIPGILKQLQVGYDYLKKNKPIFWFGVASFSNFVATLLINFFAGALYVNNHLQKEGDVYATSEVFYAIGAVFAGIAIRKIFERMSIPKSVIILTILGGMIFGVLAVTNQVLIFYFMLLLLGIANAGTRIQRITYLFRRVPNQVYGRVGSFLFLTNISLRIIFLAIFSMTFFQTGNNVVYAFGMISIFLFLSAWVLIRFYPSFLAASEVEA